MNLIRWITHTHICEYYEWQNHPVLGSCIEMEWIDGRTLDQMLAEGRHPREVYDKIVAEICDALCRLGGCDAGRSRIGFPDGISFPGHPIPVRASPIIVFCIGLLPIFRFPGRDDRRPFPDRRGLPPGYRDVRRVGACGEIHHGDIPFF